MKIKVKNGKNYIVYNLNIENKELIILEKNMENDIILNTIFKEKNYDDFISWLSSRVGGKELNEVIEIAKYNKLKTYKDKILVEIL